MPGEPQLEVPAHVRPLRGEYAVHHHIARAAIAPNPEMPDHAVLLRTERFDRALRAEIEIVGAQSHDLAPQRVEAFPSNNSLQRVLTCLRQPPWAYQVCPISTRLVGRW